MKPYSDERADLPVVVLPCASGGSEKLDGQYDTWAVFDEQGKFLYQFAGC